MRKKIISKIVCPKCRGKLKLIKIKQKEDRITEGKFICGRCNLAYDIVDGIVYFRAITKKDKNVQKMKEMQNLFLKQEFRKEWLKNFTEKEIGALRKEWNWLINELDIKNSKSHLEWAVGTGRFLRNILNKTSGEIIVLDIDYSTCLGLKILLEKLKKYSKITIILGDAKTMPFIDNAFDSVSCWHGIDEPNIEKALDESKRVLRNKKTLAVSGVFFEKKSESLKIAKRFKINFAEENKAYQYFIKKGFKKINYKIFIKTKEIDKRNFLPCYNDFYTVYGISGEK
ncbi:MAG: methyltransferase domain-containing protein [Candidatus Pacebacteria bacterium]|nr:methyltransferase domain-containing protein [Candidatus Paceibacterota bacterium]